MPCARPTRLCPALADMTRLLGRSEEHTSELQSLAYLVCRLLLEKKNRILGFVKLRVSVGDTGIVLRVRRTSSGTAAFSRILTRAGYSSLYSPSVTIISQIRESTH